jgi:hypothetical protein
MMRTAAGVYAKAHYSYLRATMESTRLRQSAAAARQACFRPMQLWRQKPQKFATVAGLCAPQAHNHKSRSLPRQAGLTAIPQRPAGWVRDDNPERWLRRR